MKIFSQVVVMLLVLQGVASSQGRISLSKPELSYYNDTLVIIFDFNNCPDNATFNINPVITGSDGNLITAENISGDLGVGIACGKDRKIIWSLARDKFTTNDEIEVQIIAEQVVINTSSEDAKRAEENEDKELAKNEPEIKTDETSRTLPLPLTEYSRANIIASSLLLPGLGQKKVSHKGAHIIMGIMGYGSLATAGYFFYDYNKKYDQYLLADTKYETDRLFDRSEQSYKLARYSIYGAAGIWTLNLIWSAVINPSADDNFTAGVKGNCMNGIELYAKWTF